jgi:hypothetical protein
VFGIFNSGHTVFELAETLKKRVLCPLSSYVLHFESIYLHFKAKFATGTLLFQVCHFLGTQKSQTEQYTLVLKKEVTQQSHVLQPAWQRCKYHSNMEPQLACHMI